MKDLLDPKRAWGCRTGANSGTTLSRHRGRRPCSAPQEDDVLMVMMMVLKMRVRR